MHQNCARGTAQNNGCIVRIPSHSDFRGPFEPIRPPSADPASRPSVCLGASPTACLTAHPRARLAGCPSAHPPIRLPRSRYAGAGTCRTTGTGLRRWCWDMSDYWHWSIYGGKYWGMGGVTNIYIYIYILNIWANIFAPNLGVTCNARYISELRH